MHGAGEGTWKKADGESLSPVLKSLACLIPVQLRSRSIPRLRSEQLLSLFNTAPSLSCFSCLRQPGRQPSSPGAWTPGKRQRWFASSSLLRTLHR